MLAYLLALLVGLGSLGLYLSTFLLPEITRRFDLFWSGVGLFYAWVLWVCAGRITGGLLLGQLAGVSLLGWFGWQVVEMRWQQIPPEQRSTLPHSPDSFTQLLRDRLYQWQLSLQKSSWRSSSLNHLNTFAEKSVSFAIVLFNWSAALIGTTVKAWEQSVPPPESFNAPETPQIDPESSPNSQKPL
jgi:Ycf66 protein N-terminus